MPYHCTAVGKVLLAFGAAELPAAPLEPLTSRTIVDRRGSTPSSTRSAATASRPRSTSSSPASPPWPPPCFDAGGRAVAALSVSGPTLRLSPRRIAELRPIVIKQARALSERLGHRHEGVHAA